MMQRGLIETADSGWFRTGCIVVACLMAAALLLGAHKIGEVNSVPSAFHKMEHFFYYGGMAVLLAHGLGRRWWWIALPAVSLFGVLDEWHQFYVPGRNASAFDWLADALGTSCCVYAYRCRRRGRPPDGGASRKRFPAKGR